MSGAHLIWADDLAAHDEHELGGKAIGLRTLVEAGSPVPTFVTIGASLFRDLVASTDVPALLGTVEFEVADAPEDRRRDLFERAAGPLVDAIRSVPQTELLEVAAGAVSTLGATRLCVRSSMVGEDSASSSFAGQLWSGIDIAAAPEPVAHAIRRCWASVFSPHALWYAHRAGRALTSLRMAVIVQELVPAEQSGVVFTADPRTGDRDVTVVSAAVGLGEGVVSGLVDVDEYRVRAGTEIETSTGSSTQQVRSRRDGTTEVVDLTDARRGARVLSPEQVLELDRHARQLAERFGRPLDIEFAYLQGRLAVLQARPITALPDPPPPDSAGASASASAGAGAGADPNATEWLWDDSNIQESFCGVTLPLTFSFASKVYQHVYLSLGDLLGVGERVRRDHGDMVRTMIGLLDGRVYYNLNSWFEGLSLLPSNGNNKADMERMMGVEEPVPFVVDQTSSTVDKLAMMGRLLPAAARLAPQYVRLESGIEAFDRRLERFEESLDHDRLAQMTIGECLRLETRLWDEILSHWQVPLINDFRVMARSGNLRRLIESLTDEPARRDRLEVELLAANVGLASVEPTRRLMRLAAILRADPATARRFAHGDQLTALAEARRSNHDFDDGVTDFLATFGGRCMGELKLETITVAQDPTFLVDIVRGYLPRPDLDPDRLAEQESVRYRAALEELGELAGVRGRAKALKAVEASRQSIFAREHLRLARTRVFDIVRRIYTTIGLRLAEAGALRDGRDVFWLTIDEVRGFHEGTTVTTDLAGLVNLRRAEFERYEHREPAHRIATRGTVHLTPSFAAPNPEPTAGEAASSWSGLGCYPGVVSGTARVVSDPAAAASTAGTILVAVRTDPGWAPLFPTAIGLVVERGSSLSHSAVIAREIGLPTVVGVAGVMAAVPDGAHLTVDGGAGTVTLHRSDTDAQETSR